MTNKKMLIASLLGVAALTVGISTYAYQGTPGTQNPDCTDTERHTAVTTMFENKDYTTFKELFADKGVARRITSEDQFLKFIELREAGIAGNTDRVNELKAELGLGQKKQDGSRGGNGKRGDRNGSGQKRGGNMNR